MRGETAVQPDGGAAAPGGLVVAHFISRRVNKQLAAEIGDRRGGHVSQTRVRDVNLDMMPYGILNHEIDVWLDRFAEMVDELAALTPFIERPGLIVLPDTSAFVEGVYFTELNWQELANIDSRRQVRLVVPVLVVEELDELKRGRNHARDRVRSVLRRLWELNSDGKRAAVIPGSRPVTVEVLADDSWHVRRPVNDNEIIERALT